MGNAATAMGDTFTCFRSHENQGAVQSGAKLGMGRDLDDAVLAATNKSLNNQQGLVNIVSLSFSCENLPNLDTFTRTDGMVVLYQKQGNVWMRLGKTEVIMDSLEPKWVKSFDVQYHFEKRESYKVEVYDIDDFNNLDAFENHDFVGSLEFALHEVVTARDQTLSKPLECKDRSEGQSGIINITGDEKQGANNEEVQFEISGDFLSNQGMNFFLVHKFISPQVYKPVYKSEIKPSVNGRYSWNLFSTLTSELANEDPEREIRIEFFKSSKAGKHTNLGYAVFNLAMLREGQTEFQIIGRSKQAQTCKLSKVNFHKRHTFLEYVFGGCEIGLITAIDFTLSNGDPKQRDSLHYLDMQKNEYLSAISSVGNILQYYDSDKQIPVFGFGATVPPSTNRASHCFALNGDIFDPEVNGLDGVIDVYKNALKNVNLYGPTNFAPIIELVGDMAEAERVTQTHQQYFILLIITDGIINDMQKTIDQIVRCSALPVSIIIVGVGSDDFESMDILDADEVPLYSTRFKKYMEADIVQFVPYREFRNNPLQLAKETLEEVPGQMLGFFRKQNIVPLPAHEDQKRKIQQKLSMQKSMGNGENKPPEFFEGLKNKFKEQMVEMGMDPIEVEDFLDDKGLVENNPEIVIDQLKNPTYVNPLKRNQQARQPAPQFDYYNPSNPNMQVQQPAKMAPARMMTMQQQQYQQQPNMMMQKQPHMGNHQMLLPPIQPSQTNPASFDMASQQDDSDTCKICYNKKINTVMIPCGHRCQCNDCSKLLNKECPICRKPVTQVVNTFDV